MSDYGGITCSVTEYVGDYRKIKHADDVIGLSIAALGMNAGYNYATDPDGNLIILGQLTYRPIRFDQDGRVIVCQRIQEPE